MPPLERIAPELTERAPLGQLTPLRGNPRRGDHEFLRESLTAFGQTEALVVNRGTHTGVPNEIVAGNNRAQVMADLGWTEAAVSWVDVPSDVTLKKLAVALNRASERATWDDHALADVLAAIAAESDLTGTGFDDQAYEDLMRATDTFGDAAAGFLGGLLGGDDEDEEAEHPARNQGPSDRPASNTKDDDEDDEAEPAAPTYMTVSWAVLPEQRTTIREALRIAQSRWQTGTAAEALVEICDRFVKENSK